MDILVRIIKNILIMVVMLITVGCNLPTKNTITPTMVSTITPQNTQAIPTETKPIPTYTPESPSPTIHQPTVTVMPQPTEQAFQPNNLFGITIYTLDEAGGLSQIAQAGSAWTRSGYGSGFVWKAIEPSPGDRLWNTKLEKDLINAGALGVEPIMLIGDTPGWAAKQGFTCGGAVAADKFPALGQFAYDLVKRYSVPPYNIRYWELWNEPDAAGLLGCWGDPTDTESYGGNYYGQMLQVVYPRIKEADPQAQVLVGGLLLDCDPNNPPEGRDCLESKFLKGILESGAGSYFDGVSFHAYDFYAGKGTYENPNWNSSSNTTGPVSIAKARYLENLLASYGYEQKYLMNTETAVFAGPNVMYPPCRVPLEKVPDIEATKVHYIIHSYAVALAEGWKANVWYSALGVRCTGLLNDDLSPKAGYYAYQFAQQKLGEAQYVRQISEYEGVMGYEYETTGRMLWVLWSLDGLEHTIELPKLPVEVNLVGDDGQAVPVPIGLSLTIEDSQLTINNSPVFIEFEK
jgi:hypothetical protein